MRYPFFMRLFGGTLGTLGTSSPVLTPSCWINLYIIPNLLFIPIRSKCCVKSAPIL
jgi:hypothetical protein